MNKLEVLSSIIDTDPIIIGDDEQLTFSIAGSGTVIAQVKLTSGPLSVWKDAQVCEDGVIYSTVTGARAFRFSQTAASGDTTVEVTGAKL